jgi:inosine-uridine nucleoside N-ribohydrolase
VWLVPTGPLTNIALALRAAPDLAGRIAGISLMGGGTFGNRTAAAEFNIWCDPEAADDGVLLRRAADHVRPRSSRTSSRRTPERIDMVRALPGRLAAVLADLFDFFSGTYTTRHDHILGAPVHDPCAVMALTHPQLFDRHTRHTSWSRPDGRYRRHDRDRPARLLDRPARQLHRDRRASTPTPASQVIDEASPHFSR